MASYNHLFDTLFFLPLCFKLDLNNVFAVVYIEGVGFTVAKWVRYMENKYPYHLILDKSRYNRP